MSYRALIYCLVTLASSTCWSTTSNVRIWAKAFIPSSHSTLSDYFLTTKKGSSVMRAPTIPLLNLGNLNDTCFETDGRTFSDDPNASARISVEITLRVGIGMFEFAEDKPTLKKIGASHNVDCVTGEKLQPSKEASTDTIRIGQIREQNFTSTLNITASAKNPFYEKFPLAPAIDFVVLLTYDSVFATLEATMVLGNFPAFEIYYSIDDGVAKKIIAVPPAEKSTASSLYDFYMGANTRTYKEKIPLTK